MEIKRYGDFNPTGKSEKKHQIILVNTSRGIYEYLQTLKYRYNGKFKRIPNYIITRSGDVLQLMDNLEYSEYFGDTSMDQNSIIISFENLGWIQREPLTDYYVNWIGDIYKGEVYEKKWRDYYFWQPYTSKQVDSCAELCNILFDKGFKYVVGKDAIHKETYKLTVNLIDYCDITYVPKNIYNRMPFKEINGFNLIEPSFMTIDYLRMLSDPINSYWRIEKSFKRSSNYPF